MKTIRHKFFQKGIMIFAFVFFLLAAVLIYTLFFQKANSEETAKQEQMQNTLRELGDETVQGIFFSMYPLETYNIEDFLIYRGLNTIMLPSELESGREVIDFLESTLAEPHNLEAVYIGLSMEESSGFDKVLQKLHVQQEWELRILDMVKNNPQIRFYLMLEYPGVDELSLLSEKEREELFSWYRRMAELFSPRAEYTNIVLTLPGAEPWVTGNTANYLENGQPDYAIAKFILGQIICNERYVLDTGNVEEKLNNIQTMIQEYCSKQATDSEYTLVFFGDSVIGNYTDSMSIPEVVRGSTGTSVFNCGYGGLSAARKEDDLGFADIVDAFIAGDNAIITEEGKPVKEAILDFHAQKDRIHEDKLVFFISLGLNDYMSGATLKSNKTQDTYTFKGALEYGVARLKEAYPDCDIVLMTPNYLGLFEDGTEVHSGHILEDYVDTVISVSSDFGTKYIDVYREAGIHADNKLTYLAGDQCHPNEYGRYEIGKLVSDYVSQWYTLTE